MKINDRVIVTEPKSSCYNEIGYVTATAPGRITLRLLGERGVGVSLSCPAEYVQLHAGMEV